MPRFYTYCVLGFALVAQTGTSNAEPVNTFGASQFRDIRSDNSVNFSTGDRQLIDVFIDPYAGTTAEAVNGTYALPLNSTVDRPQEFLVNVEFGSVPLTPWTITATNGGDTSVAVTNSLEGADKLDFVRNVRIERNGLTPTLHWELPAGFGGPNDFMRIGYFDDDTNFRLPFENGSIFQDLSPNATSYTFADGVLEYGQAYAFRVITTRNEPGVGQTRATTFLNFTPIAGSGGPEVYLPTVDATGVFNFDFDVVAGESVILDPFVATGYAYETGVGDPNFASVMLPSLGDDIFTLSFTDPNTGMDIVQTLMADDMFFFPTGGVGSFVVNGIEPALGLDPGDVTAFMTTVAFTEDGAFTGTMTAITQFVSDSSVSEPAPFLLVTGVLMPLFVRRRSRRRIIAGRDQPC